MLPEGHSHEYDLPTSAAWAPFQKIKMYDIPDRIFEQYNQAQVSTMMGLFEEINHAWIAIHNSKAGRLRSPDKPTSCDCYRFRHTPTWCRSPVHSCWCSDNFSVSDTHDSRNQGHWLSVHRGLCKDWTHLLCRSHQHRYLRTHLSARGEMVPEPLR